MLWFGLVWAFALGHASPGSAFSSSISPYWGEPRVDHYSTIGFPSPNSVEEQLENTKNFVTNVDTVMCPASQTGYKILHLPSKCGAELWGGANPDGVFFGNDPHFFGLSRMCMKITAKTECNDEGTFQGWASNYRDDIRSYDLEEVGSLQLDFYCPTYQLYGKDLVLPTTVTVQMAAFAHEVQIFDSIQDYNDYNKKQSAQGMIAMADQSFGAMSLFFPEKATYAVFTGRIVQAERKINERTGAPFYWALVETLGDCQFDVVIHPSLVDVDHPPRPGCILQGSFFLSGRLLPEEDTSTNET